LIEARKCPPLAEVAHDHVVRIFVVDGETLELLKGLFGQQKRDSPRADARKIPRCRHRCRKHLLWGDIDSHRSQS
jgi:hypothetical protein